VIVDYPAKIKLRPQNIDSGCDGPYAAGMGDKSPKATQKQAAQKQRKKGDTPAAKQAPKTKK
jgi:hypothetical protein